MPMSERGLMTVLAALAALVWVVGGGGREDRGSPRDQSRKAVRA
jgi:hypothetical protein